MSSRFLRRLRFGSVVLLVSFATLEGLLLLVRHLPVLSTIPPVAAIARELYMLDRNVIQFGAESARWDERLGYTLRPGVFGFGNTEFDTRYQVNDAGLRDDQTSLDGPEIVVIGDSFAMGWGVEQEETFPQVLERLSGRKVLNTAVASYGTARQLRLLEDLDLSRATHLVIQFCNNDYFENQAFEQEGPAFAVQDRDGYDRAVVEYRKTQRYFPGRYSLALLGRRLGPAGDGPDHPDPQDPASQRRQAELFLDVLIGSPVDLSGLRLVVFELNGHNREGELFVPALQDVIAAGDWPGFIQDMKVVDLAEELGPDLFFRLDDHITADGHHDLAERLWQIIRPRLPPRKDAVER